MGILLNNVGSPNEPWVRALQKYLPGMAIYEFPDISSAEDIEYAVVWNHPHGDLLNYPNLKAVLVLGAGMDHIDAEPELPKAPIVRLVDPAVGDDMAQYSLYWAMHFQRHYETYRTQAKSKHWRRYEVSLSADYRVTILGLGPIGTFIAERFALNNFNTQGWSRKQKYVDGVNCFYGDDGLEKVLANTDVLVNCLPLNTGTHHFLNEATLSLLPRGSNIVNVSRGSVIDDSALSKLLDSGHISAAALDTFVEEPLPEGSDYWSRDNVFVTPHVAGGTYAKTAAKVIADNILRVENGQQPFPIYKRENL